MRPRLGNQPASRLVDRASVPGVSVPGANTFQGAFVPDLLSLNVEKPCGGGSSGFSNPLRKAGQASTQRAGMVAQQSGPANRSGGKLTFFSVRLDRCNGGSDDFPQGNVFVSLLGHVATKQCRFSTVFPADQAVQEQPLAIGKQQDGAGFGVRGNKRAHDNDGTGWNQREHAVAVGPEAYRIALPQELANGFGSGHGPRVFLLGEDGVFCVDFHDDFCQPCRMCTFVLRLAGEERHGQ